MARPLRSCARITIALVILAAVPLGLAGTAAAARVKTIAVNDVSIVEGDSGSKSLSFTVSWSGSKGGAAVSVSYATADDSAVAGSDYTSKSGTVGLSNGGCRCGTVAVPILGDNLYEGTETFRLNLTNPVNAVIGDGQGVGTIYDNEGPPALIATDATADEGAGTISMSVVLTSGVPGGTTVDYATADGTAAAGSDYSSASGTLSFSSGQTSKTIAVPITDDALAEDAENFTFDLSNASVAVTDGQGLATITDNDPDPDASVGSVAVGEGGSGGAVASFPVTLTAPAGREIDVDYATSDVTAIAGADYTAATGTLVIPAGTTSLTIDVPVLGDAVYEGDETFSISLSAPVNANLLASSATGTIIDDDPLPSVSVGDAMVTEGNTGTVAASFPVTLTGASAFTTSIDWSTADATAIAGSDYQAGSGTVSFAPGETAATISVSVLGDVVHEGDETFQVQFGTPTGLTVADGTGVGTIHDDDKAPTSLKVGVAKTRRGVTAKGTIESAASGMRISVTLMKKKGTKYVKVASKIVTVTALGDRDGDALPDAAFVASFKRPAKGAYEFVTRYTGGTLYLPGVKILKFKS